MRKTLNVLVGAGIYRAGAYTEDKFLANIISTMETHGELHIGCCNPQDYRVIREPD
jgi:hypothetical protein